MPQILVWFSEDEDKALIRYKDSKKVKSKAEIIRNIVLLEVLKRAHAAS